MIHGRRLENRTEFDQKDYEVNGLPEIIFANYSKINNETVWINDTEHQVLGVSVINSDETVVRQLNFTWECIDFSATEMVLQLYFQTPLYVSAVTDEPQSLRLLFHGQQMFKSINGKFIWPSLELRRVLPR